MYQQTLREIFDQQWIEQGNIDTDDRKETYWKKSPYCLVDKNTNKVHFVLVFPGKFNEEDYQINFYASLVK